MKRKARDQVHFTNGKICETVFLLANLVVLLNGKLIQPPPVNMTSIVLDGKRCQSLNDNPYHY